MIYFGKQPEQETPTNHFFMNLLGFIQAFAIALFLVIFVMWCINGWQ